MNVSECMEVIWKTSAGFEQSSGIYFYGYFEFRKPSNDTEKLKSLWNSLAGEIKSQVIEVQNGNVLACTLRLIHWPSDDEWTKSVEEALRIIVAAGALVAWCGGEDCTWSTDVLDPTMMAGNIYAAYAESVGFLCNAPKLTDECVYLSDNQLSSLHKLIHQS